MQTTWRYDPTTLRLFIATCEEGSFAKAAERECMGASAVSKRIAELEEAVGSPLLYRFNKGVQPTPAGQCLLEHAQRLLNEMLKMSADLSQFTSGEKGHVRIHANRSSIIQFLPHDLNSFLTAHPHVDVELEERTSEQVIENILGNQCDIGIGAGLESASLVGLAVQNYHIDHLALVVRDDHPLAGCDSLNFAESLVYRHIALHRDSPLYQTLDKAARAAQRPINYGVHLQSFDAVCRMIQSGLGIAVLPDRAISESSEDSPLVKIPLTDGWANRQFHVVSQPRDKRSATTQSFLDFVQSVA
ncbi:LysR substrate-binding domain-containing protein [Pseudomonas putida]|uniref:LysR family transcriptional regulator n=1 Tax=Pseudomonas putida TaxID=303 RepID=A0A6I6XHL7_PSEPU|nr:LysR substrate-binding domain-containing protein [Pseudomonas putida]QHG65199.1 LysR family transcriptional regulator [Pseudomonas putida]